MKFNQEINKRSEIYKAYVPLGISIGMFFALNALGYIFMWIVIIFSAIIFRILIWLEFIHIQEKAVLKEVIDL